MFLKGHADFRCIEVIISKQARTAHASLLSVLPHPPQVGQASIVIPKSQAGK